MQNFIQRIAKTIRVIRNNFALGVHNGIELWGGPKPQRYPSQPIAPALAYRLGHACGWLITEPVLASLYLRPADAPELKVERQERFWEVL